MPILNHFDLLAPIYERVIHSSHPEMLLSCLDLPEKGIVLDAGGGTGRVAKHLLKSDLAVVVADLSMGMLQHSAIKDKISRSCADTGKLPFPDRTFDRITMVDALHHVVHQRAAAAELWRVLKVNGRLVIEEPNIQHLSVKLIALIEKLALMDSHIISPPEIEKLFAFDNASVQTILDGHTAWIIIKKNK